MKKIIIAILAMFALVTVDKAFAYWKPPVEIICQDPSQVPFENMDIK
ncbi:MAG: hypothetical protein ABH847_02390 [Candidatus Omnitrophota bacterium]